MQKVSLAITDFALPSPRCGSIDVYSGLGRGAEMGLEIHQRVQGERARDHANYRAEVPVSHMFAAGDFQFVISGRMDGVFVAVDEQAVTQIEEIKSAFNIYELSRKIKAASDSHPYVLQLQTYGYFHWLETTRVPLLNLHLVSSRNGEAIDMPVALDTVAYEAWLSRRLCELVASATKAKKRAQRRKKAAQNLAFPFSQPRPGQVELIATIDQSMQESRPLMVQAPTGLGKTIGVLYPTLREAMERGQRVVYLTPKNSQHGVAEDAIDRLQESGANIKALTITAKSKMCFKNETLCNPDYCEYAKDHYSKVADHQLLAQLARKRSLKAKTIKKVAKQYQVCPFELQMDAAFEADAVICDYNYVFAPHSALSRVSDLHIDQQGKPNLVIDEAHNLPARAMDYYSPALSTLHLEQMRPEIKMLSAKFQSEANHLLDGCIEVIKRCGPPGCQAPLKIQAPSEEFLQHDALLRDFLTSYLKGDIDIQPRDVVLRLAYYWSAFTDALQFVQNQRKEFFTTYRPDPPAVAITCCDASEMLKDCYTNYAQVVAFSATLKPFNFYSQLTGLESANLRTAEFVSPFPSGNRKLLIIPQISSKFSQRERNYPRIAETIQKIAALKGGNYAAFFPSFEFMNRVLAHFTAPEAYQILRQQRHMLADDISDTLANLRLALSPQILFAVQGGVFSEGVDHPGDMLIGTFVVGPPLPNFALEREEMRAYYELHYKAGFDYAYVFPAMAKAVQAAGRVIRSETDKGLIVLLDSRFTESNFAKSMPLDWFAESPMELVSESILNDVRRFWDVPDLQAEN
jgi:DNA excision repair protein ERCC-2